MTQAVKLSGDFFRGDVGRQAKRAVSAIVRAVTVVGKQELQAQLFPGHGKRSGAFRKGIRRRTRGLEGAVFASNQMIAQWLEGEQTRNRTTRFKGLSPKPFAAATARTDHGAGDEARKGVSELVRALGGE